MKRLFFSTFVGISLFFLAVYGIPSPQAKADEAKPENPVDAPAVTASSEDVSRWIMNLDSDSFQTRQQATNQLAASGRAAIEPLAKAAEGGSLEVTTRCLDVLSKLLASGDGETKAAAAKALQGLTKSKNVAAARRADALINPQKPAKPPVPQNPFGNIRIQIQGIQIGRGGARIKIRTVNGQKTIEAEENGKKVKIEIDPEGGIKMQITEKVDGKEKTSKFAAKDAEALKKNHPAAYKLYQKYSKRNPGAVIRIRAIGGLRRVRFGVIPQQALDQIEKARKQLQESIEQLRKLAKESRIDPQRVIKLADKIEAAKKQLDQAQKQLGR